MISVNVSNRCSYSKKILGSGTTALIVSNEEIEDIMKIVKSLEESESGLLIKGISEKIENETKESKAGLFPVLWGTLAASILGNALTGKATKSFN